MVCRPVWSAARLTDHDRVTGFQQLSLLGLSAAQITKRAGVKKEHVAIAPSVAASEVAAAVTAKVDLTLDQAVVLAEFDADADSDAVKELTVCAVKTPDRFAHLAQQCRDARAEQSEVDTLAADLGVQGTTVVDQPGYGEKSHASRLHTLVHP